MAGKEIFFVLLSSPDNRRERQRDRWKTRWKWIDGKMAEGRAFTVNEIKITSATVWTGGNKSLGCPWRRPGRDKTF